MSHDPHSYKWISKRNGNLYTNTSVDRDVFQKVRDRNCNIISIFGLARQGKSFLMNCLAGERELFTVSNNMDPCTTGIDISDKWLDVQEFRRIGFEGSHSPGYGAGRISVGFVDAEGQGDQDVTYDAKLVCPILLASKCVIYNHKGELHKDKLLETLGVMARAASNIGTEAGVPATAKKFSHLHIVFRDWNFAERGEGATGAIYQRIFDEENTKIGENRDRARREILSSFASVRIWIFDAPAESKLLKTKLSIDKTTPEFRQQLRYFRVALSQQLQEPLMFGGDHGGGPLTGRNIGPLMDAVVAALNRGESVLPQAAFTNMIRMEIQKLQTQVDRQMHEWAQAILAEIATEARNSEGYIQTQRDAYQTLTVQLDKLVTIFHDKKHESIGSIAGDFSRKVLGNIDEEIERVRGNVQRQFTTEYQSLFLTWLRGARQRAEGIIKSEVDTRLSSLSDADSLLEANAVDRFLTSLWQRALEVVGKQRYLEAATIPAVEPSQSIFTTLWGASSMIGGGGGQPSTPLASATAVDDVSKEVRNAMGDAVEQLQRVWEQESQRFRAGLEAWKEKQPRSFLNRIFGFMRPENDGGKRKKDEMDDNGDDDDDDRDRVGGVGRGGSNSRPTQRVRLNVSPGGSAVDLSRMEEVVNSDIKYIRDALAANCQDLRVSHPRGYPLRLLESRLNELYFEKLNHLLSLAKANMAEAVESQFEAACVGLRSEMLAEYERQVSVALMGARDAITVKGVDMVRQLEISPPPSPLMTSHSSQSTQELNMPVRGDAAFSKQVDLLCSEAMREVSGWDIERIQKEVDLVLPIKEQLDKVRVAARRECSASDGVAMTALEEFRAELQKWQLKNKMNNHYEYKIAFAESLKDKYLLQKLDTLPRSSTVTSVCKQIKSEIESFIAEAEAARTEAYEGSGRISPAGGGVGQSGRTTSAAAGGGFVQIGRTTSAAAGGGFVQSGRTATATVAMGRAPSSTPVPTRLPTFSGLPFGGAALAAAPASAASVPIAVPTDRWDFEESSAPVTSTSTSRLAGGASGAGGGSAIAAPTVSISATGKKYTKQELDEQRRLAYQFRESSYVPTASSSANKSPAAAAAAGAPRRSTGRLAVSSVRAVKTEAHTSLIAAAEADARAREEQRRQEAIENAQKKRRK